MTGAIGYGKALFLVSEEDGSTEKVMNDIKVARAVFSKNPDYAKLLNTPALPKSERVYLVDKAFSSLDLSLVNLIKILTEKRLANEFCAIADAYLALYDESRGIERVEAVTAVPLTPEQERHSQRDLAMPQARRLSLKIPSMHRSSAALSSDIRVSSSTER